MLSKFKKTKIVGTLGPASDSKEIIGGLIDAGLNVCRLNFSHGTQEEHKKKIDIVKELREEKNKSVAILLDTRGPEVRTGDFKTKNVVVKLGQKFTITMDNVIGDENRCTVTYKDLINDVKVGDTILIDDGLVEMEIKKIEGQDIICEVLNSGILNDKKGVNFPGVKVNLPAITAKDEKDIIFGIENDIDYIAASYARKATDILEIREILENNNGENIKIIAKIENQEGIDNILEILEVADGIMVARGDLGVEIPTEEIPILQKELIQACNKVSKPVITATQMLDSMIRNPRPTRAEVTDVANAIFDGTDAIMLSGETASGKYPIQAVQTMAKVALTTENRIDYDNNLTKRKNYKQVTITNAISHATCTTASDLNAKAIVTATSGGYTARMVSSYRPKAPIIASTNNIKTYQQLSLLWGVFPILNQNAHSTSDIIDASVDQAIKEQLIENGNLVIITAGVPVGKSGTTNLLKVHIATKNIVRGIGVGNAKVYGKAQVVKPITSADMFQRGNILVTNTTNKEMMDMIEKASALIVETGGITSHAAIVGLNLGIPVIVSAENATKLIKDGEVITVDSESGIVYSGEIKNL